MKQMWVHASYIECLLYVPNLYSDCLILVHNLFQLWKHNILVYYECANTTYCGQAFRRRLASRSASDITHCSFTN